MSRASLLLLLAILCISTTPLVACSRGTEYSQTAPTETEAPEVVLSGALSRDCQQTETPAQGDFDAVGLQVGEKAIDFTLEDVAGNGFTLSQLLAEKPVMMVFGSCT